MTYFFLSTIISTTLFVPIYSNDSTELIELNPVPNNKLRKCVARCENNYLTGLEVTEARLAHDISNKALLMSKKADYCVEVCTAIYKADIITKQNRELVQYFSRQPQTPNTSIGMPSHPHAPAFGAVVPPVSR